MCLSERNGILVFFGRFLFLLFFFFYRLKWGGVWDMSLSLSLFQVLYGTEIPGLFLSGRFSNLAIYRCC
ncbi:hypothetical protein J3E72DRAFT_38561 [Bipolaris maydis]|uniref:uncharacterized protein n=1 Tax=Cochliobolus heterostrophus TaxID=5016 RepID=UPI0024D3CCC6|nr:hypothetical protein J3E73DRAFT_38855 [Bipolaris maydis]KAJ5063037.1 hypothetical protein J3E74DRAFT_35092 [Bipolaris maydis]KAJ6199307.1 hypothetical protein J3E72DRAFT_38561 [Bipolaris maydis]KAJ6204006.1 hypothetical protein PSV09DRAFT_2019079 [Bipolaris maydis]KAJ6265478.1 hypothetical protein PSV08DRAFT_21237 [Bipolaris maydis]